MKEMMFCCSRMSEYLKEDDYAIVYIPKFREYGLKIFDGGSSMMTIEFCPWCGKKLPTSLRDVWFERLNSLGINPDDPKNIPGEFKSDTWWRKKTRSGVRPPNERFGVRLPN